MPSGPRPLQTPSRPQDPGSAADRSGVGHPQPSALIEIRPIRPSDAALIIGAISYTSPETYYRRFHMAKRRFTSAELRYLTDVDGHTHVALVAAQRGEQPRLAAVARYATSPSDPLEGELGICVHDPFRRQGLGARMLIRLHDEASMRGVRRLRAIVQADNLAMRELLYRVLPGTRVDGRAGGEVQYVSPVASTGTGALAA